MDNKITRRCALKRMGLAVAGATVLNDIPSFASVMGVSQQAQQSDSPTQSTLQMEDYKEVFRNEDVVFHQINDHLWVGNGHQMYNESIYIVEGNDKAAVIDTGTKVDHLNDIVAGIVSKPQILLLTHTHGDHAGSINWFPEIWLMPAEGVRVPRGYSGKVNNIENHQIFDLGGRKLEAFYTPGHTRDSVTFIDKANHFAVSGDAFGSTNLLMTCELSTFIKTAQETLQMMNEQQIYYMLPGHFDGTNAETSKRVYDLLTVATDVLAGKRVGEQTSPGLGGINRRCTYEGVRFNYSDRMLR